MRGQTAIKHLSGGGWVVGFGEHRYAWSDDVSPATVQISVNTGDNGVSLSISYTPKEARELAAALLATADVAEKLLATTESPAPAVTVQP